MSIQPLNTLQDRKNSNHALKVNRNQNHNQNSSQVAFKGAGVNPVVGLMDFIDKGGYAASFIIQDGLGFILPRMGKGVLRGSKVTDENGNPVLDENGKQKREYNWEYARKEGIREIITGPSAFVIPLGMLAVINKYAGRGNNVKLNYIDSFNPAFTDFAKNNMTAIKNASAEEIGKLNKVDFYEAVFKDVINKSINTTTASNISTAEIDDIAKEYATRQVKIEDILSDKKLNKKAKAEKIKELGGTIEDSFMNLKKSKVGGTVNELAVSMSGSNNKVSHGSIGELLGAMNDYFDDAMKSTKKALSQNGSEDITNIVKQFTNRRMGSRVLTNLGIFAVVSLFYTQIPKLYNMGLKGNPALKGTAAANATPQNSDAPQAQTAQVTDAKNGKTEKAKDVPFTGLATTLEKTGEKVFNSKGAKSISDIFELNGPIMSGKAMSVLLYGFCIPPRLQHAQDKYEYGEVVVRDFTAFTALLFGAKALARLFSDGFSKLTGLALNKKDMDGRNIWQKTMDYLNPSDDRHSVLSSKQLDSKYTNIHEYKDGVNGFVDFIEGSGGNIKKALSHDKKIKAATDEIVQKFSNKSFADATVDEIKQSLRRANLENGDAIKKFYNLFDSNNGLLKQAKTYNSTFGFLSTILLVPGLIIWLTDVCEKMTQRRTQQDFGNAAKAEPAPQQVAADSKQLTELNRLRTNNLSMAGFMNKQ